MSEHIYTIEELTQMISCLLKKYHAESGLLFGSYARQEATHTSDIDLLVLGGNDFDPTDIFSLADELHRVSGKNVDVYELCELEQGSPFYNEVFSQGVSIA